MDEVCEFLDSRRVPVNNTERAKRIAGKSESELFPYYGANGRAGWIDDYLFDERLILLAEDGGNFGSTDQPIAYAVTGRYWVNNHAHVLRPLDGIDFDYCLQAIRIRPDIGDLVSGSTRGKLNQQVAAAIPVPLPPLPEQQRIAAILTVQMAAVERARTAAEAQLQAAKALPAAYLRAVFESDEARGWPLTAIQDFAETSSGTTPPRGRSDYYAGELPWVKTGELRDGVIHDTEEHVSDSALRDTSLRVLPAGTLLIAMYGQGQTRGRTGLLARSATTNQACFAVLPSVRHVGEYLQAWFRHSYSRIRSDSEGRGGNQSNLNGDILRAQQTPLPPVLVQQRIGDMLNGQMVKTNKTQDAVAAQLQVVTNLPAALLRRAFSGAL